MKAPSALVAAIRQAESTLLIAHIMPDGDAIGSLLGLGWALRRLGKAVVLACQDPLPQQIAFLPGTEDIVSSASGDQDLIIALDSSDPQRLGRLYHEGRFGQVKTINMDHHVTNARYADINWVEPVAATAQMCLALIAALDVPLDAKMATCLLAGLVTDTQGFRTSNTTAAELRAATTLMKAGASLADITDQVFKNYRPARLCLWGRALSAVQWQDGILWTEITREMLDGCQATEQEADGLVSFLDTTRGALVSIVFREKDGEIEASMRAARGMDISGVALGFGGGGHPQAAGCTLPGEMRQARDKVLQATAQALREQERAP